MSISRVPHLPGVLVGWISLSRSLLEGAHHFMEHEQCPRVRSEQATDVQQQPKRLVVRFRPGYKLILQREIRKHYDSIVAQVEARKKKRNES
jgi:hypothetical protein